ncbi:extracellular calcium-sensing receptor [Xenopus laevis]|uniref:Extracellular calcium-sensing receptor n=2 Tax=Xenopus laevis TaxID=8355 RepID=A0A8J0UPB3_XENLA|nr:extracellular calcium-sensing receptor [Xenopus laevis]
MAKCVHGREGMGSGISRPLGKVWLVLEAAQKEQEDTKSLTSFHKEGHQTRRDSKSVVFLIPGWPDRLELCKECCSLPRESIAGNLSNPGDIVIGGTFPVHLDRVYNDLSFTNKPAELQCQRFSIERYQYMHALIFAVEEINGDPELLPNITLGFQIFDTCTTLRRAAQGTLSMLSGGAEMTPNYHCSKGTTLAGVVGDSGSTRSILMAQILGLYRYPLVSYLSSNAVLSNRDLFPSFFRTIPSDDFQMRGLAHLVLHYGWTWIGLLISDNDYGQFGLQIVKQEIINGGACVAFAENIMTGQPNRNAPHLVQVIRDSTAKVVVVIASDSDFVVVVEELQKQNVTGNIWIASEAWATSISLRDKRFQMILVGTIGFAIHGGKMSEFTKYFSSLKISKHFDMLIKEFWEEAFSCKWPNTKLADNATTNGCTGNEKLENLYSEETYRIPLNVYTAIYAVAWALHGFLCTPRIGPLKYANCPNVSSFQPWHIFHYIKYVNFMTKDGIQVSFDANGNPPAVYDIVNWHVSGKGTLEQVTVGSYDLNAPDRKTLTVDEDRHVWANNSTEVPFSKCSPSCSSGFRKVMVPGKPSCCYECAPCPQGQISNQTDAVECHPCSWDTWPNLQQDRCLPRNTEFLSYEESLGYSLAAISIFSSLIPLIILGVFIHHKKTPIVRANNYSLSCLLLLSLFFCFLCSLAFIGYPQPEKCHLRQVAFGMVFALCISCVLAKTITVVIAFNATKPGSRLRKWTGVRVAYCIIGICSLIQLCVSITRLIFFPPFPNVDTHTKPGIIIVYCTEGSPTAFWCMLGYLGLLATISFIVAFMARRLPDRFNEAKFITFSMLAFLSVWVSFIPAYLSARGMYTVAMEVFAILSSSWAVVGCIFVPKCFIMLLRPNLNTREPLKIKANF